MKNNPSHINVLLIEDNEDDIYFIRKALKREQYKVEVIENGTEGYQYLLEPAIKPDIVLLDYHLPGYDGIEILHKIKEANIFYPFIFLTVENTIETVKAAMKAGAMDFISKTTDLKKELPDLINKVCSLHKELIEKGKLKNNSLKMKQNGIPLLPMPLILLLLLTEITP